MKKRFLSPLMAIGCFGSNFSVFYVMQKNRPLRSGKHLRSGAGPDRENSVAVRAGANTGQRRCCSGMPVGQSAEFKHSPLSNLKKFNNNAIYFFFIILT
jgi:hypothetical protein